MDKKRKAPYTGTTRTHARTHAQGRNETGMKPYRDGGGEAGGVGGWERYVLIERSIQSLGLLKALYAPHVGRRVNSIPSSTFSHAAFTPPRLFLHISTTAYSHIGLWERGVKQIAKALKR